MRQAARYLEEIEWGNDMTLTTNELLQAADALDAVHSGELVKIPSRGEVARVLEESDPEGGTVPDEGEDEFSWWYDQADAVLTLMRGERS